MFCSRPAHKVLPQDASSAVDVSERSTGMNRRIMRILFLMGIVSGSEFARAQVAADDYPIDTNLAPVEREAPSVGRRLRVQGRR